MQIKMTNGTPHSFMEGIFEFLKGYNLFLVALLWPLNNAVTKYFAYLRERDREAISKIVTEVMQSNMSELKNDIKEIKQSQENDRLQFNKDIKELLREIKR